MGVLPQIGRGGIGTHMAGVSGRHGETSKAADAKAVCSCASCVWEFLMTSGHEWKIGALSLFLLIFSFLFIY
jgi:hypothetical protein